MKRVYRNPQGFLQGTIGRFKRDVVRVVSVRSIINP